MKKRAQFFIIASLLLIFVISSLVIYKNSFLINKKSDIEILKSELNLEISNVIDYEVANNSEVLDNFTKSIVTKLMRERDNLEMVLIFKNDSNLSVLNLCFENITLEIEGTKTEISPFPREGSVSSGGISLPISSVDITTIKSNPHYFTFPLSSQTKEIKITLNNITYTINLLKNKKLYFLIKKTAGENVDIEISK
ncbi:MAG: hypothetical protein QW273_03530 [Candidatus Pacearchaeota archaeon]